MRLDVPDWLVYGLLTLALATGLVYAGVIIGSRGTDKAKRGVNIGSPSPRRKSKKNKGRSLGNTVSVVTEKSSGGEGMDTQDEEETNDDGDIDKVDLSILNSSVVKEPKAAVATPSETIAVEPVQKEFHSEGKLDDDFSLVTKKKDKKKGTSPAAESAQKGDSRGVNGMAATPEKYKETSKLDGREMAVEATIEREVVSEAAKELTTEEVSSAALSAAQEEIALAIMAAAQEEASEGSTPATSTSTISNTGTNTTTTTAAAEVDDDGWNVVNKRVKTSTKMVAETRPVSPIKEKKEGKKVNGAISTANGSSSAPSSSSSSSSSNSPSSSSSSSSSMGNKDSGSTAQSSSGKKNGSKLADEEGRSSPPTVPASTAVAGAAEVITIDLKHLGAVIGTKGSTRLALQKLYDTSISVPKTERSSSGPIDVTIAGPPDGIKSTISAIRQLCEKGYASCLGGEGFSEGAVQVPPQFVSEIVGKSGACAKAIQEKMEVRLTIPQGAMKVANEAMSAGGGVKPVLVGIAGAKEKVKKTKELIKELIKYHHTEVTHPGLTHIEMEDIPVAAHSHIIGKKGAEIARISSAFSVTVHIPYDHSVSRNVILVGKEEGLKGAEDAVKTIVERFLQKEKDVAAASASASVSASPQREKAEDPDPGAPAAVSEPTEPASSSDAAAAADVPTDGDDGGGEEKEAEQDEEEKVEKVAGEEGDEEEEEGDSKLQLEELGTREH